MPCERYGTHPITFVGVAGAPISRWFTPAPDMAPFQLVVTPLTVERAYRGVDSSVVYLRLDTLPALETGRRYLVYGSTNFGNAREVVSPELPLETVEEATADLAFLDAAALSRSGGTIYGTLATGRMDDMSWPRRPLAGITIRFVSNRGTVETVTGDDGRFVVSGVPEGSVRIEPLLPDGLKVQSAGTDVRAGGCTPFSLVAEFTGRVRGLMRHADGTPMTWLVDAVPVDPRLVALSSGQRSVRANDRGDFEFVGVPPGAYLVGVNLLRPASLAEPYAPTYFPGTTDRDNAIPIVVGEGTIQNGIDLTLHDPILKGQLQLLVLSDQGPGDVLVCMRDISNAMGKFGGMYTPSAPGEPVTITVLEGEKYQFLAHVERSTSHSESEVVEVVGATGRQVLTLKADAQAPSHQPGFDCHSFFSH